MAHSEHQIDLKVNLDVSPLQRVCVAFEMVAERTRQVRSEGWTVEHDDEHSDGALALAAAAYAAGPVEYDGHHTGAHLWPFEGKPKFKDRRRDLIRAGALILAELERLDRVDGA